jgi:hypothetical protein
MIGKRMNTSQKNLFHNSLIRIRRDKEKDFIKKNLQLMRIREIDARVEATRQDIIDRYIELESKLKD